MSENKHQFNDASVESFLNTVGNDQRRNDSIELTKLMEKWTGEPARMYGTAIVGFGTYHYKYETGREGDAPLVAFSPRKQNLTLYVPSSESWMDDLLKKLGKHTTSKVCLYIKRLSDVDMDILKKIVENTYNHTKKQHVSSD